MVSRKEPENRTNNFFAAWRLCVKFAGPSEINIARMYRSAGPEQQTISRKVAKIAKQDRQARSPSKIAARRSCYDPWWTGRRIRRRGTSHSVAAQQAAVNAAATMHRLPIIGPSPFKANRRPWRFFESIPGRRVSGAGDYSKHRDQRTDSGSLLVRRSLQHPRQGHPTLDLAHAATTRADGKSLFPPDRCGGTSRVEPAGPELQRYSGRRRGHDQ